MTFGEYSGCHDIPKYNPTHLTLGREPKGTIHSHEIRLGLLAPGREHMFGAQAVDVLVGVRA